MLGHTNRRVTGGTMTSRIAGTTIADVFDEKDNNFNFIRMVAAVLVLFSHCFPMTGTPWEPFANYLGSYGTGGSLGVAIFFIISGFLVTRSVCRHSTSDYVISRMLRILPALALVTGFDVFVVGPVFTTETFSQYFSSPITWAHLWNVRVFPVELALPGMFAGNPLPGGVNGSLWTLPIECGFYVVLPLMLVLNLLGPRAIIAVTALAALIYAFVTMQWGLGWSNQGDLVFRGALLFPVSEFLIYFLSGACIWLNRERIAYSHGMAAIMLLLLFMFADQKFRHVALFVALPYLVIYCAATQSRLLSLYRRLGDYSYGTYLFAFPVQQAIVAIFAGKIGYLSLLLVSFPITLCFAVLSWWFIERPAVGLRKRFIGVTSRPLPFPSRQAAPSTPPPDRQVSRIGE